jgi:hypothetical protein
VDGFENLCYGTNVMTLLVNLYGKFSLLGVKSLPVIQCESTTFGPVSATAAAEGVFFSAQYLHLKLVYSEKIKLHMFWPCFL